MKNLNCPDCSSKVVTKNEKARIAFLGGSIVCQSCGAQLKAGGRFISTLVGAVIGSVSLYIAIYSVVVNSWLPIIVTLGFTWCLVGVVIYYSGFKRVGTKQFHI